MLLFLEEKDKLINSTVFDIDLDIPEGRTGDITFSRLKTHPEFSHLYNSLQNGLKFKQGRNYSIWIPRNPKLNGTVCTVLELLVIDTLTKRDDWGEIDSKFAALAKPSHLIADNMFAEKEVQETIIDFFSKLGKGNLEEIKLEDILGAIIDGRIDLEVDTKDKI